MNDNIYQQMSLFEFVYPTYKIKKPIRLIELFAGYGSQFLALKYLGANVESHKIVEWAIPAILAYKDIHYKNDKTNYAKGLTKNELVNYLYKIGVSSDYEKPMTLQQLNRKSKKCLEAVYNAIKSTHNLVNIKSVAGGDLNIVNTDKYEYILTYSFPCQDLSLAGKGAGLGEGTRSGLLWQVERILLELKDLNELPQILLMENVPMILSPKYRDDLARWDLALSKLGYKSYVKNLIATDYLIPQIRNRTFMISILGEYSYSFPYKLKKEYILKDFLENNVDEKYFLSDKMVKFFEENSRANEIKGNGFRFKPHDENSKYSYTITTRAGGRMDDNFIVVRGGAIRNRPDEDGTLPTLTTRSDTLGVVVREEYQGMYQYSKSDKFMKGKDRFTKNKEFADTIVTTQKEGVVIKNEINGSESLRIRKLTPKECFRLMGVKDDDYSKLRSELSNSQRYCLAGNSIVVNVLMAIFNTMLDLERE